MNVLFYPYVLFGLLLAPVSFLAGTVMQRDGASIGLGLAVVSVVGVVYIALLVLFTFRSTLSATSEALENIRNEDGEVGVAIQQA